MALANSILLVVKGKWNGKEKGNETVSTYLDNLDCLPERSQVGWRERNFVDPDDSRIYFGSVRVSHNSVAVVSQLAIGFLTSICPVTSEIVGIWDNDQTRQPRQLDDLK